jgi:hypothetical protein
MIGCHVSDVEVTSVIVLSQSLKSRSARSGTLARGTYFHESSAEDVADDLAEGNRFGRNTLLRSSRAERVRPRSLRLLKIDSRFDQRVVPFSNHR